MKPKSTTEHAIVALSNNLPTIAKQQHERAFSKCFPGYAVHSRNSIFCLECGHDWKVSGSQKPQKITCPSCSKRLQFTKDYKNGLKETDYYQIITTADEYQVVR